MASYGAEPSPSAAPHMTGHEGGTATLSALHPDILHSHILSRLDGLTLASTGCASSQLHALSSDPDLWTAVCHSTWPSTATSPLRELIATFPGGACTFFSDAFPLLVPRLCSSNSTTDPSPPPPEFISAVDLRYCDKLIFSKFLATETVTGWFRCSPFRIDMLDPKDVVPTTVCLPEDGESACLSIFENLTLSWVVVDPAGRQAVNLSSHRPVAVQRHWLSGELHVRFATILCGERGCASEFVQFGVVVTCGRSDSGEMHVREVSLQAEDTEGTHLTGKDSFAILQRALEGRIGRKGKMREDEGRKRYGDYLEIKREKKERKLRIESRLDMLCIAFGGAIFAAFCWFILRR